MNMETNISIVKDGKKFEIGKTYRFNDFSGQIYTRAKLAGYDFEDGFFLAEFPGGYISSFVNCVEIKKGKTNNLERAQELECIQESLVKANKEIYKLKNERAKLEAEIEELKEKVISDDPSFMDAVTPAIKFLAENYHPHARIIVETDGAEIVEGVQMVKNDIYTKD